MRLSFKNWDYLGVCICSLRVKDTFTAHYIDTSMHYNSLPLYCLIRRLRKEQSWMTKYYSLCFSSTSSSSLSLPSFSSLPSTSLFSSPLPPFPLPASPFPSSLIFFPFSQVWRCRWPARHFSRGGGEDCQWDRRPAVCNPSRHHTTIQDQVPQPAVQPQGCEKPGTYTNNFAEHTKKTTCVAMINE